ncbi:Probable sensor-like histidine kinase YehU [Serratia fonticola]|uniref:Probable sensor-like histidine kinase YehU n=1 Tax=Serratia fonticola TaxID=47917 RepID=A0A4U9U4Y5_SERFO|nr:Probable sensor-like histidine kinase YehU [Serratia fonticola]
MAGQYERHKQLLAQSEIKLLHAQVNPHFLFNALNTLVAVIRRDGDRACELVQYLSTFFRKNLKRSDDEVSLADEIEHVNAYLQIEKARFADRAGDHRFAAGRVAGSAFTGVLAAAYCGKCHQARHFASVGGLAVSILVPAWKAITCCCR